jgi:hypothetical protein
MQHPTTLHEIARIERAEALRRAERVGPAVAALNADEPVERTGLRSRVAARIGRTQRTRTAVLPETPAA